jgi:hypothetical protein
MTELKKGDLVRLKQELLGNEEGALGVVYEEYDLGNELVGISAIFENGESDCFDKTEQRNMLERVGHDDEIAEYDHRNVRKLREDFKEGVFKCLS